VIAEWRERKLCERTSQIANYAADK
jgi:hypothetical protein